MWMILKWFVIFWILCRKLVVVKCLLLSVFGGVFEVVVMWVLLVVRLLRSWFMIIVLFGLLSLNLLIVSRFVLVNSLRFCV